MKKTIYKYVLKVTDHQEVTLPVGATILSVQVQREAVCLWAMVDPEEEMGKDHTIEIYRTGHPVEHPEGLHFIGTVQLLDGRLVFHVFERIPS